MAGKLGIYRFHGIGLMSEFRVSEPQMRRVHDPKSLAMRPRTVVRGILKLEFARYALTMESRQSFQRKL